VGSLRRTGKDEGEKARVGRTGQKRATQSRPARHTKTSGGSGGRPPEARSRRQGGIWKILSSWKGRLAILAGLLAALAGIISQSQTVWGFARSFFPADLDVAMTSCKSDDLKVEILHRGGAATWLGPPSYRLHSPMRPDSVLQASLYGLDDDPSQRRLIAPRGDGQAGATGYHYGGPRARFYNEDEAIPDHCRIVMTLPSDDRSEPIVRECRCGL